MTPPLKFPGGKTYLAPLIHRLAPPPHKSRLIPFAGGLGELWGWDPVGVSEVVNDIDGRLCNLWRVLADPLLFEDFRRKVEGVPVSRSHWEAAARADAEGYAGMSPVDAAVSLFVFIRQSMMGLGKSWAPLSKSRTRRGLNEQASAWWTAVDGLDLVHARLARVAIENDDAVAFLRRYDHPEAMTFIDPPYFPGTREPGLYRHEMTEGRHRELLAALLCFSGKVLLSGYANPLYDETLRGWSRLEVPVASHMSKKGEKPGRVEVLWANYDLPVGGGSL